MNIYQIKQEYLSIFEELEENGGELTEELSKRLSINENEFTNKIENYTNIIKSLKNDLNSINEEQNRLKELKERKSKSIEKLENVIIEAINQFGDTKKSGVKYVNYTTGEVSVKKTPVVKVNTDLVDIVGKNVDSTLIYNASNNQLDTQDKFDVNEFISLLKDRYSFDDFDITNEDLENIDLDINILISLSDIMKGNGYNAIKEVYKNINTVNLKPSVSKVELKHKLKENGSYCPNLAKLDISESLIIK